MFFTLAQIERSIFETIRLRLVADGYLPDRLSFASDSLFRNALKSRETAHTPTIEVINDSPFSVKGGLSYSRIIIEQTKTRKGNVAGGSSLVYENNEDGTFDKLRYPSHSVHLEFDVRYITDKKNIDRYCFSLLQDLFGGGYHSYKGLNQDRTWTEHSFATKFSSGFNVSDKEFLEKGIIFEVRDVFISPMLNIGTAEPLEEFLPNIILE